jgi:hypothetical protein
MFCSRCGSEITGKSKFCPSCGLDLMATTPVHAIATGALQELDLVREATGNDVDAVSGRIDEQAGGRDGSAAAAQAGLAG